jgi:hypothetical protein
MVFCACADDGDQATAKTSEPRSSTTAASGEGVIVDNRCDPAEAVLDDAAYGLMSVLEDLDTGSGPSDSVECTFLLVGRTPHDGDVISHTFEVTPDGEVVEGASETLDFSHLARCEDYFGDGVILRAQEAFDLAGCVTADGDPAFYLDTHEDCAGGRTVYWSDGAGWGYDGEPWHADAFEPPANERSSCENRP